MKTLRIPPKYTLNRKVAQLLSEIEANRAVISSIKVPLELEQNIRRQSILGSALFSARIEGNTLTSPEVQSFADLSKKDQRKVEVANLCRIIEKTVDDYCKKKRKITKKEILRWQKYAMKNILNGQYLGKIRTGHEGLFDAAGNIVYHAPPPSQINSLLTDLLHFANSKKEKIVPIRAILSHLAFEQIHPFVDGNGRVGRLIELAILCSGGYDMKGLVIVEQEIDNNRQSYYRAIEHSTGSNCQPFLELMLELLRDASTKAKDNLLLKEKDRSELDVLPPRQKEIALIVSEHKLMTFDSIHRRFLKISPRQIAYDLHSLEKLGYVQKIGKTRGALYSARS